MRKVQSRDPASRISDPDDRTIRDEPLGDVRPSDDDLRDDDRLLGHDLRETDSGVRSSERERIDRSVSGDTRRDPGDAGTGVGGEASSLPRSEAEDGAPLELFDEPSRQDLRSRWESIQTGFVDEPRRSVEEADKLVDETTKRLSEGFAKIRNDLEEEWKRGEDVSTEDLRRAFRRYRSFFDRLVNT